MLSKSLRHTKYFLEIDMASKSAQERGKDTDGSARATVASGGTLPASFHCLEAALTLKNLKLVVHGARMLQVAAESCAKPRKTWRISERKQNWEQYTAVCHVYLPLPAWQHSIR